MPSALRGLNRYGGGRWFLEDCEWALVALAFPDAFSPEEVKIAHATARCYYPEAVGALSVEEKA